MEYKTHQRPVCQTADVSAALLPRLLSRLQPSTPRAILAPFEPNKTHVEPQNYLTPK